MVGGSGAAIVASGVQAVASVVAPGGLQPEGSHMDSPGNDLGRSDRLYELEYVADKT